MLALLVVGALPSQRLEAVQGLSDSMGWEATIREFEGADRQSWPAPGAVVFVGSSSIVRWTTLAEDFPSIRTLNRGFGGSVLRDVIQYVDRIILPYRPSHVVVHSGDEELSRGMTGDQIFAAYQDLVTMIHLDHPQARITWIAMKPSPALWPHADVMRAVNDRARDFARGDLRLQYVDVFTPMLTAGGTPREELFAVDNLHLNAQGYALWSEILSRYVER